ncbi:hypothetical protein IWQ47_003967 [Aquimarina sp. EL_43]|uniref:hypothetical protein n=1 Tax=unclassified Aquimarina TaxID=2627091 RepID=UPI0018C96DFC|nr:MULTISPECIES: hypothetical protein [unclassified Aquimarina]MBG6132076.1 hypothetical protein [Aquimarina sp. EL_35]MBG6152873.1 hypothetical protein [Aquimarina sp. EL_32]MBG6170880.1 hypothetical protein [Aquimarina sp. EL_43]
MIKQIKNFILIVIFFPVTNSFSQTQNTSEVIEITPIKTESFKYYQLEAKTTEGVAGKIYLNGKKLHEFEKSASQVSNNKAQKLIKNGTNEIVLKISSIDKGVEKGYFSKCVVFIAIHGVNEKIFPSKETQIIHIKWNPKKDQKKGVIKYVFELKR